MNESKFKTGDILGLKEEYWEAGLYVYGIFPTRLQYSELSYNVYSDFVVETLGQDKIALICKVWPETKRTPLVYECIVNGKRGFITNISVPCLDVEECLEKLD